MGEEAYLNMNATGVIPSPYDSRDYSINSIVESSELTLPTSYRVPVEPYVFSQGSVGCCVACALASCRCIQEALQEGITKAFSVNYIYGNRRDSDTQGSGMMPRQALQTLTDYGDCHLSDFGGCNEYSTAKSLYMANKEKYDELAYPYIINSYYKLNTVEEIKTAVYTLGCAIVVYDMTRSLRSPTNGYVTYNSSTKEDGTHCITIVGWTEDDHWIILNSWGTDYGIDGYCYVPFDYPIIESWAMVDDLRYEELIIERDFNKVVNVFFGIKKNKKKRYLA